jgi:ribose transport system substrate-binding protein
MMDELADRYAVGLSRIRIVRCLVAAAALAAAAASLSACGSSSSTTSAAATTGTQTSGSSATVTAYKAAVAAARQPLSQFSGPTTSPGPIPKGKNIWVLIPVPAPNPNNMVAGLTAADKAVGWTTKSVVTQGTPQGFESAMGSAINSHASAIVLADESVPLGQTDIKKARAAGIPVVGISPSLPTATPPPEQWTLNNYVAYNTTSSGKQLGQWTVANSPGGLSAIVLNSPEFPDIQRASAAYRAGLAAAGPQYKVAEVVESPVTDIAGGQVGPERLAAAMRAHPEAKYMFLNSESWVPIFLQAEKTAGRTDITALGSDGDVSVPLIKQGQKIVMDGGDSHTYGWYAVDALIRAFNHMPPIPDGYNVPHQLVDSANAPSINTPGISVTYDYQAAWKKLWGIP